MMPIILISKDDGLQEEYISGLVQQDKILPYLTFKIKPNKEEISIEQIREIKKDTIVYSKNKRLFILYSFDSSSIEAQNALLKTLEENTGGNQFILLVSNQNRVLPTIQSRCQIIKLDKNKKTNGEAKMLHYINTVKSSKDFSFLADKNIVGISKTEAISLIDNILIYLKENLAEESKFAPKIIRKSLKIRRLIQDNNLNTQLAIDNLLIFINKVYSMK